MDVNVKQIRNNKLIPYLEDEGTFYKEFKIPEGNKKDLKTHERLCHHHTLSSVRRCSFYNSERTPNDRLDLALSSIYDHGEVHFPRDIDYHLQRETVGVHPRRRLKNTFDKRLPEVVPLDHPLKYGGVAERSSPHNIELMNSGHHSAKTAPGYARQPLGGNIFYY